MEIKEVKKTLFIKEHELIILVFNDNTYEVDRTGGGNYISKKEYLELTYKANCSSMYRHRITDLFNEIEKYINNNL